MARFRLAVLILALAGLVAAGAEPALRLAYAKTEADVANVYVANADGSGARQVTNHEKRGSIVQLAWSPDGKRLAFVQGTMMDKVLAVADVATGKTTAAVKAGFDHNVIAVGWTPDGQQLLYLAGGMFKRDLYLAAPDGSGAKPLTKLAAAFQPVLAWAPNGKSLAVPIKTATSPTEGVTNYGPADVHLLDPVTGAARVLAKSPGDDVAVAWAPDGQRLLVAHVPIEKQADNVTLMGPPELRLVTVADGKSTTLSPAKAHEQEPAWSPDGKLIALSSVRGGGSRSIYVQTS